MKKDRIVLYIDKNGFSGAGSDSLITTDLKTITGINNRLNKHHEWMFKKGYDSYVVMSWYNWYHVYDPFKSIYDQFNLVQHEEMI